MIQNRFTKSNNPLSELEFSNQVKGLYSTLRGYLERLLIKQSTDAAPLPLIITTSAKAIANK